MKEKEIIKALQTAIIARVVAIALPSLPATAVKYLGRSSFEIPDSGKWLEIVHIPNNPDDMYLDDTKVYRGILRLVLHWPMDDKGVYEPMDVIDAVCQGFVKGTKFYEGGATIKIYENPNLTAVDEQAPQSIFPASIRYMCFQQST